MAEPEIRKEFKQEASPVPQADGLADVEKINPEDTAACDAYMFMLGLQNPAA